MVAIVERLWEGLGLPASALLGIKDQGVKVRRNESLRLGTSQLPDEVQFELFV